MDVGETVGVWIHALATVVVLGYYGILGRIVLPALSRSLEPAVLGRAIAGIERRALPFVLLSTVAFTVSGGYLLVIDPEFGGLGNAGASRWNSLMLVKHGLVGLMVVGGIGVHMLADRLADRALGEDELRAGVTWLRLAAEGG